MKGLFKFKSRSAQTALAVVALAFAPTSHGFAGQGFNNADLKGDYSWETTDGSGNGVAVGIFSADGGGLCTLLPATSTSPISCGYTVAENGVVSVSRGLSNGPFDPGSRLILNNNNAGADGYEIRTGGVAFNPVKLVKQSAPPGSGFNTADLKGSYSWRGPTDQGQLLALFIADGAGSCTILDVEVTGCTYIVQPNGVVTIFRPFANQRTTLVLNNRGAGAVGINLGKMVTLTKQ